MSREIAQVLVGVEPGFVTVAKIELDRVVADLGPTADFDFRVVARSGHSAVAVAEKIGLALVFRTRGGGAELGEREIALSPSDQAMATS
jgi:hypothetical protein